RRRRADAEWAACQPGTGHREMQIRACRRLGGFEPDLRYASDDFLILLELVRTTGACALLPDLVLSYGAPSVAVRAIAEGTIVREAFLLTRATRTPAIEAVADALTAAAPQGPLPGLGSGPSLPALPLGSAGTGWSQRQRGDGWRGSEIRC